MAEIKDIVDIVSKYKEPVVIDYGDDNVRVIAELFEHARGIVYADIGFCDPTFSGHPFHVVEGELTGENPWRIGRATLRTLTPEEPLYDEWKQWKRFRKVFDCTRSLARNGIREDIGFE